MTPTVSVVIPLFNGLPYVQQALDSVLSQTYPVHQIVITDGGSTDGSLEWLRSLRLPNLIKKELPIGTTAAENWTQCSNLAVGAFVKLLCQDDFLYPHAIEVQVENLMEHPNCNMAVAKRDIVDSRGVVIAKARGCQGLPDGAVDGTAAIKSSYIRGTNVFGEPVSTLFRREPMREALPWLDDKPYVLDIYFDTAVLLGSSVFVHHGVIGAFRVSSSSWSTQLADIQKDQFQSWQRHAEQIFGPPTVLERVRSRIGVEMQTLLRRFAYTYLRFRKSLDT